MTAKTNPTLITTRGLNATSRTLLVGSVLTRQSHSSRVCSLDARPPALDGLADLPYRWQDSQERECAPVDDLLVVDEDGELPVAPRDDVGFDMQVSSQRRGHPGRLDRRDSVATPANGNAHLTPKLALDVGRSRKPPSSSVGPVYPPAPAHARVPLQPALGGVGHGDAIVVGNQANAVQPRPAKSNPGVGISLALGAQAEVANQKFRQCSGKLQAIQVAGPGLEPGTP